LVFYTARHPPHSTLFPYTTLFRSGRHLRKRRRRATITRIIPNSHGQPHAHIHRRCRTMRPIAILALSASILTACGAGGQDAEERSEEHTSELQSRENLVCRLLLEK